TNRINVSQAVARNILHKHRIWGRIAAKKPGLTPRQAEAQLVWCNACINWSKQKKKYYGMGCFTGREKGPLVFRKERNGSGTINSQRYIEMLKENLIPFRYKLIANFGNNITFQDDNAPIHTAKYTREWMEGENI
ncbi:36373_t:CDS:2, partial [Racocetra persica]